jgi:hypothetical protein
VRQCCVSTRTSTFAHDEDDRPSRCPRFSRSKQAWIKANAAYIADDLPGVECALADYGIDVESEARERCSSDASGVAPARN